MVVSARDLRIAFFGAGYIATKQRETLLELDASIVAVADPNLEAAIRFAAPVSASVYSDYVQLLETEKLDAVYVCVPPNQHGVMEESLIRKHLPFFVEKPLATDIATPLRIDKELARSGVATAVGYHWRHLESTHRLRRELSGKRVHLAIAQWHDGLPGSPWWWDRIQSGGQVIEQATHLIDLCQMVLGDISRVSAFETQFPSLAGSLVQSNVPSATVASVTFSSGAVAAITCTYAMQARHCIQVEFISDGLSLTVTENGLRTVRGVEQHYYECQSDAFLRQAVEFVGMVKGKKPINLPSYHEALRSHGAAVAIANAANNSGGDK